MPLFYRKQRFTRKEQSLARLECFRKEVVTDAHIIPLDELCVRLNTDPVTGLTAEQAKEILYQTGPNALTPPKKTPEIVKFFHTQFSGFSLLLWVGALLSFLSALIKYSDNSEVPGEQLALGTVLVFVVVVTGSFMYIQEFRSQKIMESFSTMIPPQALVIRGGRPISVLSKDVVIGDLVDIKFGDRIPADIRIIHSQNLKVDNSPLTGEAEPQPRSSENTHKDLLETKNIVFFSTSVVEGTGRGIVVACGDSTVMGHIAGLTTRIKPNETPLSKELTHFMRIISCWAISLGLVFGILSMAFNYSFMDTVLFVIGIIVANVPEGLLATVTVCLTITAKRMASKNCLIKNLHGVETLGSTSVICSDKTGTLTQNKMTVCHLWIDTKVYAADTTEQQTKAYTYKTSEAFQLLARCAALCNKAEFLPDQPSNLPVSRLKVRGDASEEGLLKFMEISMGSVHRFRQQNRKLAEIPFSSVTKFQSSVHLLPTGKCLVLMKGAPERILEKCETIHFEGATKPLNKDFLKMCNAACEDLAKNGERVLGFCDLELDSSYTGSFAFTTEPPNFPQNKLRFLGFISLIDPPRAQVPDAVSKCRTAGIRVFMVTGDHPLTAQAIAEKVGIITTKKVLSVSDLDDMFGISNQTALVIHGSKLKDMTNDDLDEVIYNHKEIVFARTSPTQKLQIVESCQRLGEIVAVTGDGVNDAPALKKADIGIAMGITGTEVSQQTADMILLDDNFASIIIGIEEGRRIFDNLKKCILYILASNVPEIVPFLAFILLSIPLPLGTIAILCIDLLTDMVPAISLGYEKAESDIMIRPPRNPKRDKLVNRKLYFLAYGHIGFMEALNGFLVYFIIMAEHGFMPDRLIGLRVDWEKTWLHDLKDSYGQEWTYSERKMLEHTCSSAFLISIVVAQWADLIACKTRYNSILKQGMGNMVLNVSLVIETLLACFLVYMPGMHYLQFYPVKLRWYLKLAEYMNR